MDAAQEVRKNLTSPLEKTSPLRFSQVKPEVFRGVFSKVLKKKNVVLFGA